MLMFASVPPAKAQFILAAELWEWPDEYGQGIQYLFVSYSDGGDPFNDTIGYQFYEYAWFYDQDIFELPLNVNLTIDVFCWLNRTMVNNATFEEGKNLIRHSINVSAFGVNVFSQQNFTYTDGTDANDPMWFYKYTVTNINCFNTTGTTYTVTIRYDIYG